MADTEERSPTLSCSRLIALSLSRADVEHMFGVVGIPITAVATHAVSLGIRFLSFHNEQSAAYAAAAYGYLTGKPGVLLTVSGPGFIHGLAGISHAAVNSWPLLMLSGSSTRRGDFQQLDQIQAVNFISKSSLRPSHISHIPSSISSLLNVAVSGTPGGCYLDLPTAILQQTISESEAENLLTVELDHKNEKKMVEIDTDSIVKAVDLLYAAERPLIVGGKGVAYGRGEDEMRRMVEITGIPFLPTPMGKGVVPDSHELVVSAARSTAIGRCDVAMVVGARLNWILHFGEEPRWSKGVRFIVVDVSEEEVFGTKGVEVGIVGDGGEVMGLMRKEMERRGGFSRLGMKSPWVVEVVRRKDENVRRMEGRLGRDVYPFDFYTPLGIIRDAIEELGSPGPIVVSEGANTMDIGRSVLRFEEPRTRLDAGTWGTMGVGLGYCIAAAVAMPERLVVAIEGDSAFGFSAMEVETLVRYGLPVIVIVFNNGGVYGGDRRDESEKVGPHKDDPAPTSFVDRAAYHLMMEAFGGKGYVVEKADELKSALSESFSAKKPAVINVIIHPFAGVESGGLKHMN